MAIEGLFRNSEPAFGIRGIHLDLKGVPPTPERLLSLLGLFADARYNAVMVEWEDTFPWTVDERFRSETAYTPDVVARFHAVAGDLGLEIIPAIQCLGHMETPLSTPGYEHLREVPYRCDGLNPLAPGARELVERMVDDVLALTPKLRYFHIGGDEACTFGTHPETRQYIQRHGAGALYLHHIEPILDMLKARNIRPILWHDMMVNWDSASLRKLSAKADLLVWGYQEHPDVAAHRHYNSSHIERFKEHGFTLWAGPSYKGGDGQNVDLPNVVNRQANALAWVEVGRRYGFAGVVATGWSRSSTHHVQRAPIDAALDSLMNLGVILHDGEPPAGGLDACVEALHAVGEGERFERCRAAMRKLTEFRQEAWTFVSRLHEQVAMESRENRRVRSGVDVRILEHLKKMLDGCRVLESETHAAFAGLVDPIWIDRYLHERVDAIRDEVHALDDCVRRINPQGHEALFGKGG